MWYANEKTGLEICKDPAQLEMLSWLKSHEGASLPELRRKWKEFFPSHAKNDTQERAMHSVDEAAL